MFKPKMFRAAAGRLSRRGSSQPACVSDPPSVHPATLPIAVQRLARWNIDAESVISLGAGTGGDTFALASLWPKAQVLLVDAQSDHEPALRAACGRDPRFIYKICAVSDADGEARFLTSAPFGGAVIAAEAAEKTAISVPSRRIDSLVREHDLRGPFVLKFDTHGTELPILAGAEETLPRTNLVQMEVYNFKLNFVDQKNLKLDEMCAHMEGLGFRLADMCDPLYRPNDGVLWQMQFFFLRHDHPVFRSNSYNAPALRA